MGLYASGTPNVTEAERLTGIIVKDEVTASEAADALHNRGVGTVIITMGESGAYISDRLSGSRKIVPGFSTKAVDTTAAGDVFNGQLAVSLAEGKALEMAVLDAHGAAALSVQKMGAQSSIPLRNETDAYLKEQLKS